MENLFGSIILHIFATAINNTKFLTTYEYLLKTTLLLLALLLPASAAAQDFEVDGIYYTINGNQISVSVTYLKNSDGSSAYSYSGDITIPETVNYRGATYMVTRIDNWAFKGCTELTSVVIPNSVTYISDSAFENCSGLTSVTMGNSVTVIKDYAFRGCSGLTRSLSPAHFASSATIRL